MSHRGAARESTSQAASIFSHADTQSSCLRFLFLKPTPSHVQWFLIQPRSEQGRQPLSETTVQRNLPCCTNSLGRGRDSPPPSLHGQPPHCPNTANTMLMTNGVISGKLSTHCVWPCRDSHAIEETPCSQG